MSNTKETYSQALERIYSREGGEGVGVKEQVLNRIEHGFYEGRSYDDNPKFWQASNISKEEFDAAQTKAKDNKRAHAIHKTLTGGKP